MKTKGFSLIEMLIVVAVLGILMAIAAPQFTVWIENTRLRSLSEEALSGLQLARMEALKLNSNVTVSLLPNNAWVIVQDTGLIELHRRQAEATGDVSTISDAGNDFTFNGIGRVCLPDGIGSCNVPAAAATLKIRPAGSDASCRPPTGAGALNCLNITISQSGSIRMCNPAKTSPDPQAC